MSMQALLGAARDTLRTALSTATGLTIDSSYCDLSIPGGQPPPVAGQFFVSVWQGGYRNTDLNGLSLDELYDLNVTLTYRTDNIPPDQIGSNLLLASPDSGATPGLNALAAAIRVALHMNYTGVLDKAGGAYNASGGHWTGGQTYSLASTVEGFVEPLRFQSAGTPEIKGPAWFWSEGQDDAVTGLAITIKFVDARRVQTLESMT